MLPKNYRTVTLLSVPGKVLARIIANRILLDSYQERIGPSQMGFCPDRSTIDAIFTANQLLGLLSSSGSVYTCLIDIKKAFDSIPRKALWDILEHSYGFPPQMVQTLRALHTNTRCKVRVRGRLSPPFKTERGVRQGCCIAPILFNLFIAVVIQKALEDIPDAGITVRVSGAPSHDLQFPATNDIFETLSHLLYADDLIIFALDKKSLLSLLRRLESSFAEWGLKFNYGKTYLLRPSSTCQSKIIDPETGEDIKLRDNSKYLGPFSQLQDPPLPLPTYRGV